MSEVIRLAVLLGDEHSTAFAVPGPGPFFISPAEGKRKVGGTRFEDFIERPIEKPPAVEPVVVIHESGHAVASSQIRLCFSHFGNSQVVIAKFPRNVRLIVTGKERSGLRDVGPFGEALSPPLVILRNRMKLRQVERERLGLHCASCGRPTRLCHTYENRAEPISSRKGALQRRSVAGRFPHPRSQVGVEHT